MVEPIYTRIFLAHGDQIGGIIMEIKRSGSRLSGKVPTEYFTGTVRIDPLFEANDPRPVGSRKLAQTKHDWRIRMGDYRVIHEIADSIKVVRIYHVRHRREAIAEVL
jgi:mRNA-degrading endonuclease RelE of RelBE toxin-antitoxin system